MSYNFTIALLSFVAALYLVNNLNAKPLFASFVAAVFPFFANSLILYILKFNVWLDIFSATNLVTVVVQFVLSYVIFKKVRDTDSIAELFVWAVGGLVVLFFSTVFIQAFL